MSSWRRLLLALAAAVCGGLVGFVVIVLIASRVGGCPPGIRTCDLPAIAAFGLGFFSAPLVAVVIGVMAFRRLGRVRGEGLGRSHRSRTGMDAMTLTARLYEHIEPLDRGSRYEDPLDATLRQRGLGEVTGGGSQLGESGEIEFADIEIQVSNLEAALPVIVSSLEASGAPVAAELIGDAGVVRQFGRQQSVAVYLDGTTLPDEVYAALDFEDVVGQLTTAAGEGSYHGYWQGPLETGLFFFGADAETMYARIEPVLHTLPIGQNARIVVRPGRGSAGARTIRMPRH